MYILQEIQIANGNSALSKWVPATLLLGDFFISAE